MYKKGNSELLNNINYRDQSARVNRKAQSSTRVRDGTNPGAARHVSRDRRPSISPALPRVLRALVTKMLLFYILLVPREKQLPTRF